MARFASVTLEQIRNIGIEQVISPYVDLKRKGRSLWGLCPFHSEKSPSFSVVPDKGFFKCFGCGAAGDSITFIMKNQGFSYYDAVVFLAEKFGINVEYDHHNSNVNSKDIIHLHDEIQILSRKQFYANIGKEAKEYFQSRSFPEEIAETFGIGFLSGNTDFSELFRSFDKKVIYGSGFFKESQYSKPYPRFFNRLMFPIRSITGSIIAFAGRSLDGGMPKYLNSAESEIFHKGSTLFNIDKAKDSMLKSKQAILVEGYFDVMRLHSFGFTNSVAPMGTALTPEQIGLIKRYSNEIVLVFDGDEAGRNAANKSLARFAELNIFPKVVFLPKEDDPDSFLLREGGEKFNELLNKREDLFVNTAKRLVASSKDDFTLKLSKFDYIKNLLSKVTNMHLRDHYAEVAADIFKLKVENVKDELNEIRYKKNHSFIKKESKDAICEKDFVACLYYLPMDTVEKILFDMDPEMIDSEEIREIIAKIKELIPHTKDIKDIAHDLGERFMDLIGREIAIENVRNDAYVNKHQIVLNYYKRKLKEITSASSSLEGMEKVIKLKEIQDLSKKIQELEKNSLKTMKNNGEQ